jgi:hypothetical protein
MFTNGVEKKGRICFSHQKAMEVVEDMEKRGYRIDNFEDKIEKGDGIPWTL